MNLESISRPTLLLDERKTLQHINVMARRIRESSVVFRPHFKTHQSAIIGGWYHSCGVEKITVSSVSMARYFADAGWRDILIAFPVNLRELADINRLAGDIDLHLLVDSLFSVKALADKLEHPIKLWIDIDVGQGRTGIEWSNSKDILTLAHAISEAPNVLLEGVLSYTGHTYSAHSTSQIREIYSSSADRLCQIKQMLKLEGHPVLTSLGDTPSASTMKKLGDIDELRPGNFVFYDLMQQQVGSCTIDDIAIGVACPVVAKYESDNRIVFYGGSAHLSKEVILVDGVPVFGQIALLSDHSWEPVPTSRVTSLSQEHGTLKPDSATFKKIQIGDIVIVLPVHACLTADLYDNYLTFDGRTISKTRTNLRAQNDPLATLS